MVGSLPALMSLKSGDREGVRPDETKRLPGPSWQLLLLLGHSSACPGVSGPGESQALRDEKVSHTGLLAMTGSRDLVSHTCPDQHNI